MEFNPNKTSDFLENPFFIKWVKHPNRHTDRYWENWNTENSEKQAIFLEAIQIAKGLQPKESNQLSADQYQLGLDRIIAANNSNDKDQDRSKPQRKSQHRFLTLGGSIAASIVLMGIAMVIWVWSHEEIYDPVLAEIPMVVKTAPKGVKKSIILPDSSRVTLNSGSEITYPAVFGDQRVVHLKGQAFFDVERDTLHPFIVKSGEIQTKVLGTSFDVKAYDELEVFHVAVVTGKVNVRTDDGIETNITPTEASFYHKSSKSLSKQHYDYETLVGWKDKILKFNRATYHEVFRELSYWYDVQVILPEGMILKGDFTGRFENQSLENVLKGMEYTTKMHFEIKGREVVVSLP
ncbi:FecR family protein [Echinicola sp. 20G]|uniref:FecR family protein n=1 Tax=Echinicola sp. 20G TaxID=2781961 RepID=UPI001910C868|nr:FecR domain-containing protein [Echinicola sp. 20G]